MSAVSNSVTPRSSARLTTAADCSLSIRIPKLLQPSPATETCRPERPTLRYSISLSFFRHKSAGKVDRDMGAGALREGLPFPAAPAVTQPHACQLGHEVEFGRPDVASP